MGILDDAIREHLELKRSHGAAEDDVRRKEAEAFGPVRHDGAAPAAEPVESEEHTQLLTPDPAPAELEPLEPAPDDPYVVHPGDEPVPDAHDHAHGVGSDPAWADDSELFGEEPSATPAAEAGAGTLEPSGIDAGPPIAPDPAHHEEQHPALVDHDHIGGEEHAPDPVFGHQAEAPPQPEAEDPPVGDPPPDEEDVLEETPEFLQDAPEHDRLWFEQKPPRDFDFGE
jgi:hypothetical protein